MKQLTAIPPHLDRHGVNQLELVTKLTERIWASLNLEESDRDLIYLSDVFPYAPDTLTPHDRPIEEETKLQPPQPHPDMVPFQLLMVGVLPSARPELQAFRGLIIDTHGNDDFDDYTQVGVASPGYIEVHAQAWPQATDEVFKVKDIQQRELTIQEDEVYIQPEMDGFPVRVFRYQGVDFFCSNYRFNAVFSWIPPLLKIWNANNGPSHQDLFGEQETSSEVHFFQILHPTLSMASWLSYPEEAQERGCLYYQGVMGETAEPWQPEHHTTDINEALAQGLIYVNPKQSMSVAEANKFLYSGYFELDRDKHQAVHPFLWPGESILVIGNTTGDIPVRIKVLSAAYLYRQQVFDYQGSFRRAYAKLLEQSRLDFVKLVQRHPPVGTLAISEMQATEIPIHKAYDPEHTRKCMIKYQSDVQARQEWLRTLFFILSPPHYRVKMAELINRVRIMYYDVGEWLIKTWSVDPNIDKRYKSAAGVFKLLDRKFEYRPGQTYDQINGFRLKFVRKFLNDKGYDLCKKLSNEMQRYQSHRLRDMFNPNYQEIRHLPDPRDADRQKLKAQKKEYVRELREKDQIAMVMDRGAMIQINN